MGMKKKYLLPLILGFGFLIRIVGIADVPPSLNWDEVSHGYNAYSILKTGKDEWGDVMPSIFRAYGDYKLPVYIYLTALSVAVFDLTAFAVRLPSVLFGTASILFVYLLAKKLSKNENIGIISALLMAISPWSFFLSRAALEANVSLTLIIAGVYYLINGFEKRNRETIYGALFLGLSVWTYNSARIFVPLLLAPLIFIFRREVLKLWEQNRLLVALPFGILLLFLIPMFIQLFNAEGSARYENVQILDIGAIAEINERRQVAQLPSLVERALYNKATYFAEHFVANYVRHFSPVFLFISGGDNYQFNIPGYGLLYLVTLPFWLYGLYKFIREKRNDRLFLVFFVWLVLSPVAASLTRESPHTLRSLMMMVPVMMFTAYGVWEFSQRYKQIKPTYYLIVIGISFISYLKFYAIDYKMVHSFAWQYGYREVANIIEEKYDDYEKIVITKKYAEPHEFILFYLKVHPENYRNDPNLSRFFKSNWYWVDRFDKFYFVNDWNIPETSSTFVLETGEEFDCASCILFTSPGNAPEGWRKIDEIKFLNDQIAFEVYEH